MKSDQIKSHVGFAQPWYYILELAPDLHTPGKERPNVALTRALLRKVDVHQGMRCLDIGSEEGLVSILLERRGAEVVAYDRVYSQERIELVREALGARFELIGEPVTKHTEEVWLGRGGPIPGVGMPLHALPRALAERGAEPFDVVIFSGVLYHVYDPLAALALVRGQVRTGGIVIVETAAHFDDRMSLNLNAAGRFTPFAIWLPSVPCLDYLLRLVRLEPVDVAYSGRQWGRLAVTCRAVDEAPGQPDDDFIRSPLHDYELAEHLDWERASIGRRPIVPVRSADRGIDILRAVRRRRRYRPQPHEKRLDLHAVF